jgi:hypothetical protein
VRPAGRTKKKAELALGLDSRGRLSPRGSG